ncbi:bifunctional riboflavin kinase/FAD synthetase [bacterium]|nr:bifunctional riboflavin kinase/FAD synthetase [bacterium]
MQVYHAIDQIPYEKGSCLTIGTFDGIHLGHQKIIGELVQRSHQKKGRSVLITFHPHPQLVIQKKTNPIDLLTPIEEKLTILEGLGLDAVLVIPFTDELVNMEPEIFVDKVLVQSVGVSEFILGYNHVFGRGQRGDVKLIGELGKHHHFTVEVIGPVSISGDIISSTKIRQMLHQGDIIKANQYLGRNYRLEGIVKKGNHIGQKLGFPTANIKVIGEHKLLPKNGVYAVLIDIEDGQFSGMANIGYRPTVNGKHQETEVHIHYFSGDLYHQHIAVEFIQRIRDERQFESTGALISQIERDRINSIEMLSKNMRR